MTVKEIVNQPNESAVALCNECMHGFAGFEEAAPRRLGDFNGQSGLIKAAVESIVAVPERQPLLIVAGLGETNVGHTARSIATVYELKFKCLRCRIAL